MFGASSFVIGSFCFLLAPLLDFFDLQFNLGNLAENPGTIPDEDLLEAERKAARYEYMYKYALLQIQRATAMLYILAGVCFVVGSLMFYPNRYSTLWCAPRPAARARSPRFHPAHRPSPSNPQRCRS